MNPAADSTPGTADEAVERAARWTLRLGLEAPAVFLLEMQKPMARFTGHGLEMILPLVPALWRDRVKGCGAVLADPGRLEALIRRIERGQSVQPPP